MFAAGDIVITTSSRCKYKLLYRQPQHDGRYGKAWRVADLRNPDRHTGWLGEDQCEMVTPSSRAGVNWRIREESA